MDVSQPRDDLMLLEELEVKRQELHSAHRQIEILTANIGHLESENTELNNALSEETHKRQNSQSYDQERSDLKYRQQITELQQCLEEAQLSEKAARENERTLQQQLKLVLETAAPAPSPDVDHDDSIAAFHLQIAELENEKSSLKSKLHESTSELQQKIHEIARLNHELAEKEEEMECMESQFAAQCSINERLREENQEMRAQMEAEAGQVDTAKKGNSLFAEVDDRRVIAEKKIVNLESVVQDLEVKLTKEQKENKRLQLQILLLRQTSSKGHDDSVVRSLQCQLEESKKTIIHLTEQLQKRDPPVKHTSTLETRLPTYEGVTDSDKLFINFLQGVITQKKKEAEEAKSLSQQNHLQLLRSELHLTEAKNEVIALIHERDKLKVMNSHLTMTLQEMQRKYEPERFAPASKEKMKIPLSEAETNLHPETSRHRQSLIRADSGCTVDSKGLEQETSTKKDVDGSDQHSKENVPQNIPCKSVRMMQHVNVISSEGDHLVAELRNDGGGDKVRKAGGGTGRFRSVAYVDMDTEPTECIQQ